MTVKIKPDDVYTRQVPSEKYETLLIYMCSNFFGKKRHVSKHKQLFYGKTDKRRKNYIKTRQKCNGAKFMLLTRNPSLHYEIYENNRSRSFYLDSKKTHASLKKLKKAAKAALNRVGRLLRRVRLDPNLHLPPLGPRVAARIC